VKIRINNALRHLALNKKLPETKHFFYVIETKNANRKRIKLARAIARNFSKTLYSTMINRWQLIKSITR